jgi:hypothetical protein
VSGRDVDAGVSLAVASLLAVISLFVTIVRARRLPYALYDAAEAPRPRDDEHSGSPAPA